MIIYLPYSQKEVYIPDETKDLVEEERARIVAEVRRKYPNTEDRMMAEAKQRHKDFLATLPFSKVKSLTKKSKL